MSATLPEPLHALLDEVGGIRVEQRGPRRISAYLDSERLHSLLSLLKGRLGYLHLSAISCVDWPGAGEFELVYHLVSYETHQLISAHIRIPRDPGRCLSVYDLHVPAAYFERDIHEMFGVHFEGTPDQRAFVLTEWDGPPPMRKDFSSVGYVEETYAWQSYRPEWLREAEAGGGGLDE